MVQLIFFCTHNFQSKFSLTLHTLSHSHSQLLGFQINPLSHTPLSINSLHSHLHLSLFQRCLLLQTLAPNVHSHLHVLRHSMCLVSLVLDIWLNNLTFKFFYNISNTKFCIWLVGIITTTTILLYNSSPLPLTMWGLVLHSWLLIEI